MLTKELNFEALLGVNDPELHRSLTDLIMVREITIQDSSVGVTITLTVPNCPFERRIEADVRTALAALPEVEQVSIQFTSMTDEEQKSIFGENTEGSAASYNRIRLVVAVMSGKGRVGKSLVTGLLATVLALEGYRVGV